MKPPFLYEYCDELKYPRLGRVLLIAVSVGYCLTITFVLFGIALMPWWAAETKRGGVFALFHQPFFESWTGLTVYLNQ